MRDVWWHAEKLVGFLFALSLLHPSRRNERLITRRFVGIDTLSPDKDRHCGTCSLELLQNC